MLMMGSAERWVKGSFGDTVVGMAMGTAFFLVIFLTVQTRQSELHFQILPRTSLKV
jgi:hypothetical protein